MRLFLLLSFVLLRGSGASAVGPELIYPITRRVLSLDYYRSQIIAWQAEVAQCSGRTRSWSYYYTAARNANWLGTDNAILLTLAETSSDSLLWQSLVSARG